MIDPWDRGRMRLGLHLGPRTGSREMGLGWALLQLGPRPSQIVDRGAVDLTGDPIADAVSEIKRKMAADPDCKGVDLHRYLDDAAFSMSRAFAEGMNREAHCLMIAQLATTLQADGIDVKIHSLHAEGYEFSGYAGEDDFPVPDFLRAK